MADTITPLIQKYTVDFASNNNFGFVKAVQGDGYATRYIDITLLNNGQPYEIDGEAVTVVIRGTKPDTTEVFNECEVLGANVIRVEITQQMSAVAGKGNYEISVISNTENRLLTSFPFFIMISKSSFDIDYVISSNEFGLLVEKINEVQKIHDTVVDTKEEMDQAISDCNTATEECKNSTDIAKEAIEDIEELESSIANAETIREQNENTRQENESERIEAENERKANETIRQENETERINAENIRQDFYNESVTAEAERQANEQVRISNENDRIEAESDRESAEQTRQDNENIRIQNENARIANEESRVTAENGRVTAETQREENEGDRQTNTATAIANCEAATAAAWEAIEDIQNSMGIDDTKISQTTVWSSYHTNEMINTALRYRISNITISNSDWTDSKVYIKNDKITETSVIDIYYANTSFDAVSDMDIIYSQGAGYVCLERSYEQTSDILIEAIMIENYSLAETGTVAGTL